ncbi:hypothetical protein GCM10017687_70580 [Streptomyces echinatus]|uniref:hypothetical protein n=1 Tax=Streptomyces echinatus TaxID=67293 RepID=UPI0031E8BC72
MRVFDREEGDELPPGVNQLVRVYESPRSARSPTVYTAAPSRQQGVISKILPIEDMPVPGATHLRVDIILNPLGVPVPNEPGQVLEIHLGWLASRGW